MRIGELAATTRISARSLRHYERSGLLRPVRTEGGHREYRAEDAARVRHIRTLLAAGLNVATIADVLPCMTERDGALETACVELVDELRDERDRISAAITDLQAARTALDAIIAASGDASAAGRDTCDEDAPDTVPRRAAAAPRRPSSMVRVPAAGA